jgi:hypothetical protein
MPAEMPTLPDHWELLNFPSTLEVHDKRTGKTVHAVYKGGMVIGGSTADLSRHADDESDHDLKARCIREALEKVKP